MIFSQFLNKRLTGIARRLVLVKICEILNLFSPRLFDFPRFTGRQKCAPMRACFREEKLARVMQNAFDKRLRIESARESRVSTCFTAAIYSVFPHFRCAHARTHASFSLQNILISLSFRARSRSALKAETRLPLSFRSHRHRLLKMLLRGGQIHAHTRKSATRVYVHAARVLKYRARYDRHASRAPIAKLKTHRRFMWREFASVSDNDETSDWFARFREFAAVATISVRMPLAQMFGKCFFFLYFIPNVAPAFLRDYLLDKR